MLVAMFKADACKYLAINSWTRGGRLCACLGNCSFRTDHNVVKEHIAAGDSQRGSTREEDTWTCSSADPWKERECMSFSRLEKVKSFSHH